MERMSNWEARPGSNPERNLQRWEGKSRTFAELVEKSSIQAENADDVIVTNFIGSNGRDIIKVDNPEDQREAALEFLRKNPDVLPDTLKDDEDGAAAFLVALAHRTNRPPYHN